MADPAGHAEHVGSPRIAAAGALLAFAGVLVGAMGAHALRTRLDADHLSIFETAVRYHMWHAIALVAIGMSPAARSREMIAPASLLIAGIALFSGSLYVLALGGPRWAGMITPLGGLSFMAGWLTLALAVRARA
ncbi:MAG: DUF423 domain-containing protein [Candidatus Eiseniibacteriota bacterium]